MIKLIWAMDVNHLVGKGDRLPWHYPLDLKWFKDHTKGQTVIMGDATYYSLKQYYKDKPLPFGKIYVASLKKILLPDAEVVSDFDRFMENCKEDLWVIGGTTIYGLALKYAQYLYITYVLGVHDGDVYFPKLDLSDFKVNEVKRSDKLIFTVYERNKKC